MQLKLASLLVLLLLFSGNAWSQQVGIVPGRFVSVDTALDGLPAAFQCRSSSTRLTRACVLGTATGEHSLYVLRKGIDSSMQYVGTMEELAAKAGLPNPGQRRGKLLFYHVGPASYVDPFMGNLSVDDRYVAVSTISDVTGSPQFGWLDDTIFTVSTADLRVFSPLNNRQLFPFKLREETIVKTLGIPAQFTTVNLAKDGKLYTSCYLQGNWRIFQIPPEGGEIADVTPWSLGLVIKDVVATGDYFAVTTSAALNHDNVYVVGLAGGARLAVTSATDFLFQDSVECCYLSAGPNGAIAISSSRFDANALAVLDPVTLKLTLVARGTSGAQNLKASSAATSAAGIAFLTFPTSFDPPGPGKLILKETGGQTYNLVLPGDVTAKFKLNGIVAGSIYMDDAGTVYATGAKEGGGTVPLVFPKPLLELTTKAPFFAGSPISLRCAGCFGVDWTTVLYTKATGYESNQILRSDDAVVNVPKAGNYELQTYSTNRNTGVAWSLPLNITVTNAPGPIAVTKFTVTPTSLDLGKPTAACFTTSEQPSTWVITWAGISGDIRDFGAADSVSDKCVSFTPMENGSFTVRASARGNTASAGPIQVEVVQPPPEIGSVVNAEKPERSELWPGVTFQILGNFLTTPGCSAECAVVELADHTKWTATFNDTKSMFLPLPADYPAPGDLWLRVVRADGKSSGWIKLTLVAPPPGDTAGQEPPQPGPDPNPNPSPAPTPEPNPEPEPTPQPSDPPAEPPPADPPPVEEGQA